MHLQGLRKVSCRLRRVYGESRRSLAACSPLRCWSGQWVRRLNQISDPVKPRHDDLTAPPHADHAARPCCVWLPLRSEDFGLESSAPSTQAPSPRLIEKVGGKQAPKQGGNSGNRVGTKAGTERREQDTHNLPTFYSRLGSFLHRFVSRLVRVLHLLGENAWVCSSLPCQYAPRLALSAASTRIATTSGQARKKLAASRTSSSMRSRGRCQCGCAGRQAMTTRPLRAQ